MSIDSIRLQRSHCRYTATIFRLVGDVFSQEMEPSVASTRNYSLDAARGILMMLGVVLHASNIYATRAFWLVSDPDRRAAFDVISNVIHAFRMPAFFWISGYFCALTFERLGAEGMFRRRFLRLALPLVTTWLTFNVVQEYVLAAHAGTDPVAAVLDGVPISHLWFLLDMLVYTCVATLVLPRLKGKPTTDHWLLRVHWAVLLLVLACVSYAAAFIVRLTGAAYVHMFDMPDLYRLATYGPFFAVGLVMYGSTRVRETFFRTPVALLFVALPLALVAGHLPARYGRPAIELAGFVFVLSTWASVAAVLGIFERLFRRESRLTRFLSDASYTVYLFHQLLVVVLGFALIQVDISPWVKFAGICIVALVTTSMVHILVVRRVPWVRLLFNGKT